LFLLAPGLVLRHADAIALTHRTHAASVAAAVEDCWTEWEEEEKRTCRRCPRRHSRAQGHVVSGDEPPWPQKHTHRTTHGGARCAVHLHDSMGNRVRQQLSPPIAALQEGLRSFPLESKCSEAM
jgi:hypothetical protein